MRQEESNKMDDQKMTDMGLQRIINSKILKMKYTNHNRPLTGKKLWEHLKFCIEKGCSTPAITFRCQKVPNEPKMIVDCIIHGGTAAECTIVLILTDDIMKLVRTGGGCAKRVLKRPGKAAEYISSITNAISGLGIEVSSKNLRERYDFAPICLN